MITLLSGGTGTPKLIQGMLRVVKPSELAVVVNTAEDKWLSHGYFSPDIDTVVYTLAGLVDEATWHGIKGDTCRTHEALKMLGGSEYLRIGDRDRATHIWRGEQLRAGKTLSEITRQQCDTFGIEAEVIPMSNDPVETVIDTEAGEMDLHEFWVKNKGEPFVKGVRFKGIERAGACPEAVEAVECADRVIIGPSNPVTSIHPIISLKEMRGVLSKEAGKVVAVSPIVGQSAFSGPAEKLMRAFDIAVSVKGVADFYRGLTSSLVVDTSEKQGDLNGVNHLKADIVLDSLERRKVLAEFLLGARL